MTPEEKLEDAKSKILQSNCGCAGHLIAALNATIEIERERCAKIADKWKSCGDNGSVDPDEIRKGGAG